MKVGDLIMVLDKLVIENGVWYTDSEQAGWKGPMMVVDKTALAHGNHHTLYWIALYRGEDYMISIESIASGESKIVVLDHDKNRGTNEAQV